MRRGRQCQRSGDDVLNKAGIRAKQITYRSPNLQAYVERFIQSLQQKALDHFIVSGEWHFDYLVREFVEHYHTERPHRAKGNGLLFGGGPEPLGDQPLDGEIVCMLRLDGLLKHYERQAA